MVQKVGSEAREPRSESPLCNLLAIKPWANFLASLYLCFLVHNEDNGILSSKGYEFNKLIHLKHLVYRLVHRRCSINVNLLLSLIFTEDTLWKICNHTHSYALSCGHSYEKKQASTRFYRKTLATLALFFLPVSNSLTSQRKVPQKIIFPHIKLILKLNLMKWHASSIKQ